MLPKQEQLCRNFFFINDSKSAKIQNISINKSQNLTFDEKFWVWVFKSVLQTQTKSIEVEHASQPMHEQGQTTAEHCLALKCVLYPDCILIWFNLITLSPGINMSTVSALRSNHFVQLVLPTYQYPLELSLTCSWYVMSLGLKLGAQDFYCKNCIV